MKKKEIKETLTILAGRSSTIVFFIVAFEVMIMISPFAFFFYSVFNPIFKWLDHYAATRWLTSFFLPHMILPPNLFLKAVRILGSAFFIIGFFAFSMCALQVYLGKIFKWGAITLASLLPVVRQSLVVHELWEAAKRNIENKINYQTWKVIEKYDFAPDFFHISDEKILTFAAAKWFEYHKLVHQAAVSAGICDIHILQPNPYVPGSKKLTEEEQRAIKNSYPVGDYVKQGYPKLQKAVSTLQGQGVAAFDLTDIFKNSEESLWVDSCHLNEMGYKIILDQMYDLLQKILKD